MDCSNVRSVMTRPEGSDSHGSHGSQHGNSGMGCRGMNSSGADD